MISIKDLQVELIIRKRYSFTSFYVSRNIIGKNRRNGNPFLLFFYCSSKSISPSSIASSSPVASSLATLGSSATIGWGSGPLNTASISAKISSAVIMLFLFSIGQGLILILAGFITSKIKTSEKFYQLSEKIMKFSGILLILVSLYIFYKIFGGILVK